MATCLTGQLVHSGLPIDRDKQVCPNNTAADHLNISLASKSRANLNLKDPGSEMSNTIVLYLRYSGRTTWLNENKFQSIFTPSALMITWTSRFTIFKTRTFIFTLSISTVAIADTWIITLTQIQTVFQLFVTVPSTSGTRWILKSQSTKPLTERQKCLKVQSQTHHTRLVIFSLSRGYCEQDCNSEKWSRVFIYFSTQRKSWLRFISYHQVSHILDWGFLWNLVF